VEQNENGVRDWIPKLNVYMMYLSLHLRIWCTYLFI